MMNVNAYIVAADPAWISQSVVSYYSFVKRIVVSFDGSELSWSGTPTRVQDCLSVLRKIDAEKKMVFLPGDFHETKNSPIENDTLQRTAALSVAGEGADWVLELDTDEVLPDAAFLMRKLGSVPRHVRVCWWPMRVLFKELHDRSFLEVSSPRGFPWYEYPGPIACRPGTVLSQARLSAEKSIRFGVNKTLLQKLTERRVPWNNGDQTIPAAKAILHYSWARSEREIRQKLSAWGHSKDFNAEKYLAEVWLPAERKLAELHNFHPVTPSTWPSLRRVKLA